jgi:hypothetical protein
MSVIRTTTTDTLNTTDTFELQDHDYSTIQDSDSTPIYVKTPVSVSTETRQSI